MEDKALSPLAGRGLGEGLNRAQARMTAPPPYPLPGGERES